jgi:hypothetical protein
MLQPTTPGLTPVLAGAAFATAIDNRAKPATKNDVAFMAVSSHRDGMLIQTLGI